MKSDAMTDEMKSLLLREFIVNPSQKVDEGNLQKVALSKTEKAAGKHSGSETAKQ
jgi:hypothetical protein